MFTQEDQGFDFNNEPTGYVKIEFKNGRGVLKLAVRNLKPLDIPYKLIIAKQHSGQLEYIDLGDIIPNAVGSVEFQRTLSCKDISHDISGFDIAAIITDTECSEIKAPLTAYENKKTKWKQAFSQTSALEEKCSNNSTVSNIAIKDMNDTINTDMTSNYFKNKQESIQQEDGIERNNIGNIGNLEQLFESKFESFSPFKSPASGYMWWRIDNLSDADSIVPAFKTLLTRKALIAFDNYQHIIVGTYQNIDLRQKYVVMGIPGLYNVDAEPVDNTRCLWVCVEGGAVSYGSFGYWLVFIESSTGKILTRSGLQHLE